MSRTEPVWIIATLQAASKRVHFKVETGYSIWSGSAGCRDIVLQDSGHFFRNASPPFFVLPIVNSGLKQRCEHWGFNTTSSGTLSTHVRDTNYFDHFDGQRRQQPVRIGSLVAGASGKCVSCCFTAADRRTGCDERTLNFRIRDVHACSRNNEKIITSRCLSSSPAILETAAIHDSFSGGASLG